MKNDKPPLVYYIEDYGAKTKLEFTEINYELEELEDSVLLTLDSVYGESHFPKESYRLSTKLVGDPEDSFPFALVKHTRQMLVDTKAKDDSLIIFEGQTYLLSKEGDSFKLSLYEKRSLESPFSRQSLMIGASLGAEVLNTTLRASDFRSPYAGRQGYDPVELKNNKKPRNKRCSGCGKKNKVCKC